MDEYGAYRDAWHPDNTSAFRGGCIRITPGTLYTAPDGKIRNPGLYIHTDHNHIAVGLTDVYILPTGRVCVATDGAQNGAPVITVDEQGGLRRVLAGGSKGSGIVEIELSVPGLVPAEMDQQTHYNQIASEYLNLWVVFWSPLARGTGGPSHGDRIADLEQRVAALESGS